MLQLHKYIEYMEYIIYSHISSNEYIYSKYSRQDSIYSFS